MISIQKEENGNHHILVSKKSVRKFFKKIKKIFYRIIFAFNKNAKIIPEKYRDKWSKETRKKKEKNQGGFFSSLKSKYYAWKNTQLLKKWGIWDYVYGKYSNPDAAA